MRAVLYLRQSIHRDDSISLELQEHACREYCTQRGYTPIKVEADPGVSGRTWSKRPAVQRVIDLIETKQADVIVLWKWSRLSRSRKDWALAADRVEVAGGRIESATEPIDTATASGRFARGVMTEYAAFQSEQIGEQWAEVRARRFRLGLPPTGSVPFGWKSFKTHIEQVPEEAALVKEAYRMYFAGAGFWAIANHMNRVLPPRTTDTWMPRTVQRLLKSPIHAGLVTYHGEVKEAAHAGIITRDEWERFNTLRTARTVKTRPRESAYLLSGFIRCGECGKKLYGHKYTRAGRTYGSYKCPAVTAHKVKSISDWVIEPRIIEWVKSIAGEVQAKPQNKQAVNVERLKRDAAKLDQQLVKLTEYLVAGTVSESAYSEARSNLETKRDRLLRQVNEHAQHATLTPAPADVQKLADAWDDLTTTGRHQILRTLIDRIDWEPGKAFTVVSLWGSESRFEYSTPRGKAASKARFLM